MDKGDLDSTVKLDSNLCDSSTNVFDTCLENESDTNNTDPIPEYSKTENLKPNKLGVNVRVSSEEEETHNSITNLQEDNFDCEAYSKTLCDTVYLLLLANTQNTKCLTQDALSFKCGHQQPLSCPIHRLNEQLTTIEQFINEALTKTSSEDNPLSANSTEAGYLKAEKGSEKSENTSEYMDMSDTCSNRPCETINEDDETDKPNSKPEYLDAPDETNKEGHPTSRVPEDIVLDKDINYDAEADSDSTEINYDEFNIKILPISSSVINENDNNEETLTSGDINSTCSIKVHLKSVKDFSGTFASGNKKLKTKKGARKVNEIKMKHELDHIKQSLASRNNDNVFGDKAFKCVTCGKSFSTSKYLNRHQISHRAKSHCCDICGLLIARSESMKNHRRIHTGETPYKCEQCGQSFRKRSMLTDHYLLHEDENALCCRVCGKRCESKASLKTHMYRHTENKPYICETCGRSFTRALHLERHVLIHSGDKPYKCESCSKSFRRKDALRSHICLDQDRPKCEICHKTFAHSGSLRAHTLTHKEKQFSCSECGTKFATTTQLKRHCLTHTGVRAFECEICDSSFARKDHLKQHVNLVHTR